MTPNGPEKSLWEMLVQLLRNPPETRGYSVSGIKTALLQEFSHHARKETIRREISRIERAGIGMQQQRHRLGPKATPVSFFTIPSPAPPCSENTLIKP